MRPIDIVAFREAAQAAQVRAEKLRRLPPLMLTMAKANHKTTNDATTGRRNGGKYNLGTN